MATPSVQNILMQLAAGWNTNPGSEINACRYKSSDTCNRPPMVIPFEIAAAGTDQSYALSGLDSLKYVIVIDDSNIGLKVGKASGAGKFTVQAGKFMVITESATFTLYLDNLSASDKCFGRIIAFGSNS